MALRAKALAAKLLLALVIAYVALSAILYFGQGRFLFPAPQHDRGPLSDYQTVTYETSDGIAITGGYRAAMEGMPTLVFFHGNAADWQSGGAALRGLADRGYGAFAASYRGYAGNAGRPSEAGLYRDGEAALDWLAEREVMPADIVLVGNSLGGGVAVELATRHQFRGLALISTFSAMSDIVAERVWWLPTGLLLRHRFENGAKLDRVEAPVLLLHGTRDQVIPADHSERLARLRHDATLALVDRAGHDLAYQDSADEVLADWLETH